MSSSSSAHLKAFRACGACCTSSWTDWRASGNRFVLTSRTPPARSAAARPLGPLRSDPHAAAHRRRHAGHARLAGRLGAGTTPGGSGETWPGEAEYLARTVQALGDGRPTYVRESPTNCRHARPGTPGGTDAIARSPRSSHRRAAVAAVRLLLRTAPAPRARLRRAQGHSGNPRRGRSADAHGDFAAAAADARLDEGLSVVAGGRGPRRVAAESATASPTRCSASGSACTAARRRRPKTTLRAKCTVTRCRAFPSRSRPWRWHRIVGAPDDDKKAWGTIEID